MDQQPIRPLAYAAPPQRTKVWLVLVIVGVVAAGLAVVAVAVGVVGFLFLRANVKTAMPVLSQSVQTIQAPAPDQATLEPAAFMIGFQGNEIGSTPTTFLPAVTGGGGPAKWVFVQDGGKSVLAQTSTDSTSDRFPLCVYQDNFTAKDVEVSTRFKAVSGKVDQAAGLVVRYQDEANYYVARANAFENNVRLYRVIAGVRTQFAGADAKVSSGDWHRLTLSVKGAHFKVLYEGTPLFEADDSTIGNAGQVGLWTKADSVTEFDGLTVNPGQ